MTTEKKKRRRSFMVMCPACAKTTPEVVIPQLIFPHDLILLYSVQPFPLSCTLVPIFKSFNFTSFSFKVCSNLLLTDLKALCRIHYRIPVVCSWKWFMFLTQFLSPLSHTTSLYFCTSWRRKKAFSNQAN